MKVLVTGGTGFIGSHMVELLVRKGHEVVCLVRDPAALRHLQGVPVRTILPENLREETGSQRQIDVVIHMAGATRGMDYASYRASNVEVTKVLLERCALRQGTNPLGRFVLVSSQAAAGPSPSGAVAVTEADPESPVSFYGKSKLEAEKVALSFADCLPLTIVRPPIVFGPRDRDVLGVFKSARYRVAPCLAGPDRLVSLVYVEDLVEGILLAALSPAAVGQTYFLANREPVIWREFVLAVARVMGYHALVLPVPLFAMKVAALAGDVIGKVSGSPRLFRSEKLDEMKQIAWVCSPEKALLDLNWQATTPLDRAVEKTAAWYRAHRWI